MTTWTVVSGDILDQKADVLVCSANPFLTLSGGVGGAFLLRYGSTMLERLRTHLDELGTRHVPPGTVVHMPPCGSLYKAVLHAVAVDGMYDSSPALVTQVVERVLEIAEQIGADTVALPALATGYGRLTKMQFAEGLRPLIDRQLGVAQVVVCLRHQEDAASVRETLALDAP